MSQSESIQTSNIPSQGQNATTKKLLNIKDQSTEQPLVKVSVFPHMTVSALKQKLLKKIGGSAGIEQIRLRYKLKILEDNNASLAELNIKNEDTIYFIFDSPFDDNGRIQDYYLGPKPAQQMSSVLSQIREAFNHKVAPQQIDIQNGKSGSYFLKNIDRDYVAIFKPLDEEPYAPNNPKGIKGKMGQVGMRCGIKSGEQGYREVIAYLLDSQGFHGVPPTTFVEFYHPNFKVDLTNPNILRNRSSDLIKYGSLQTFIKNTEECGNYGSSIFSVEEVHKIGILDIRIINCDRNNQNILVRKNQKKNNKNIQELAEISKFKPQILEKDLQLIPIDHGLSLPDCFQSCEEEEPEWMYWDQAEHPFSDKTLKFIDNINIEKDLQILTSKFNIREECLFIFRIANTVLKEGAKAKLNLKEIGEIVFNSDNIKKLIDEAKNETKLTNSNLSKIIDRVQYHNMKREFEFFKPNRVRNLNHQFQKNKLSNFSIFPLMPITSLASQASTTSQSTSNRRRGCHQIQRSLSLPYLISLPVQFEQKDQNNEIKQQDHVDQTMQSQNNSQSEKTEEEKLFFDNFEKKLKMEINNILRNKNPQNANDKTREGSVQRNYQYQS